MKKSDSLHLTLVVLISMVVCFAIGSTSVTAESTKYYIDPQPDLEALNDELDYSRNTYDFYNLVLGGDQYFHTTKQWVSSHDLGHKNVYTLLVKKEGLVTIEMDPTTGDYATSRFDLERKFMPSFSDSMIQNVGVQSEVHTGNKASNGAYIEEKYIFYAYPGTYYFISAGKIGDDSISYYIRAYQEIYDEVMPSDLINDAKDYPDQLGTAELEYNMTVSSSLRLMHWRETNADGSVSMYDSVNGYDKFQIVPKFSGEYLLTFTNNKFEGLIHFNKGMREFAQTESSRNQEPSISTRIYSSGFSERLEADFGGSDQKSVMLEAGKTYNVEVNGSTVPTHYTLKIDNAFAPAEDGMAKGIATASSWAVQEIEAALGQGLKTESMTEGVYTDNASREDFAEIAMTFYDQLGGPTVTMVNNPFSDTSNREILRAKSAGIINGTSATTFSPDSHLTREQMCVMILRALDAAGVSYDTNGVYQQAYRDVGDISPWADDSVKTINAYKIMNGSGDTLNPQGTVTKEMAMLMLYRAYMMFK